MKKFAKIMLSVAAVTAVSSAIAISAMAADTVTGNYDKDSGKVTLKGVVSSGAQQTLLVLSEDRAVTSENANDVIAQIDQKDELITEFKLKKNLESGTYYIRIGGSDGTLQTGTLTIGGGDDNMVTVVFADSDMNGTLTAADATMLGRAITGSTKKRGIAGKEFTTYGDDLKNSGSTLKFADSDENDTLTAADATMLGRAITNSTKKRGIAGASVQIPASEYNN